jgi:hypothetical protein
MMGVTVNPIKGRTGRSLKSGLRILAFFRTSEFGLRIFFISAWLDTRGQSCPARRDDCPEKGDVQQRKDCHLANFSENKAVLT